MQVLPDGVFTLQGRIDTFAVAHHLTKRRASSVKKRAPATVQWPHNSPFPTELARAGFFYQPSSESPDNCKCFTCYRQLDGWEEGDDPISEHIKHSPDCGWAINALIGQKTGNGIFVNEDPMSERLAEARTATFAANWPYEGRKGWKCKVAKMVAAGWCYDPSPEYDDGVTCMYCNLSLDGWEPKDDPFVEHQRRAADCEFFKLLDEWAAARKQAKGRKGRVSRGSKVSRLSTQSNVTTVSEAPSMLSLGDDPAAEDDSILTTATNATTTSTAGKGRKKAPAKGKSKAARGKKKGSTLDSFIVETDPPEPVETITAPKEPPKRETRRKASRTVSTQLEDTIIASQPAIPTRAKTSKSKAKQRLSEDESQLLSELQAAVDSSLVEREDIPKPKRGTKRTSDGLAKLDSSVIMLPEAPVEFQAQQDKAKRVRKPTKQATVEPNSESRTSDIKEVPQRVSSLPPKGGPKSKKGKNAAKPAADPETEPEPIPEPQVQYPTLKSRAVDTRDFAQSLVSPANPYDMDTENQHMQGFAESLAAPVNPYEPVQHTPEPAAEPSPAPSTPTPARNSDIRVGRTQAPAKVSPAMLPKDATPTSSPQSSDAENHPPSSRPSTRLPLSVPPTGRRIPLADTTPDHVNVSPSKRNVLNNITSTIPWSPTDLETVFLNSPVKANLALNSVALSDWDKENQTALDAINLDKLNKKSLEEVVKRVKKGMTAEERKMSVEEWVRWNAKRAEERLRGECEIMVTKFETEGGRALRALEGIVTVD